MRVRIMSVLLRASLSVLSLTGVQAQTPAHESATPSGLPVVSPDGTSIVFSSSIDGQDDLFLIPSGGGKETRLTASAGHEAIAGWTPDGKQLVYALFANDTSSVYVVGRDGSGATLLCRVPGRSPAISSDGHRLLSAAGTWTATRLLLTTLDGTPPRQINDGASIAWNTHWSPDGKRIAYTGRKDSASDLAVYVMDADGSNRRQVTHIPAEEGGAQCPAWSADGAQLAVQVNSRIRTKAAHIWIVNVETGKAVKLASHNRDYLDETPSWFPDGKRIAFQSDRTGVMKVWVMNADGTGARQLTH